MVRLSLALVLVAMSGLVLLASSRALDAAGAAVGSAANGPTQSRSPRPTAIGLTAPLPGPPNLISPSRAYTNIAFVTLRGRLPTGLKGGVDVVRVYRQAMPPILVAEIAVGTLPEFTVPDVELLPGDNGFTATISGSGGETAPSEPVRYVYESAAPRITILGPAKGTIVGGTTVAVIGRVPVGSNVVIRNLANSTGSAVAVGPQGIFTGLVALAPGTNNLVIGVIDRAGNQSSTTLTVVRKAGARH